MNSQSEHKKKPAAGAGSSRASCQNRTDDLFLTMRSRRPDRGPIQLGCGRSDRSPSVPVGRSWLRFGLRLMSQRGGRGLGSHWSTCGKPAPHPSLPGPAHQRDRPKPGPLLDLAGVAELGRILEAAYADRAGIAVMERHPPRLARRGDTLQPEPSLGHSFDCCVEVGQHPSQPLIGDPASSSELAAR